MPFDKGTTMDHDDRLEEDLGATLKSLLEPVVGRYPRWGSSPQSVDVMATPTRSRRFAGVFTRHPLISAFTSLCLVLVIVASTATWLGVIHPITSKCAGCSNPAFWAVSALSETQLVAVGGTDDVSGKLVVATSSDAGKIWSISYPDAPALTTLARVGSRLVGATECDQTVTEQPTPTSCLFASDDGGRTWQDLKAGTLVDPSFADASHGVALSAMALRIGSTPEHRTLYATSNAGSTWQAEPNPCDSEYPWLEQAVAVGLDAAIVRCSRLFDQASKPAWELVRVQPGVGRTVVASYGSPGDLFDGVYVSTLALSSAGIGYIIGTGRAGTPDSQPTTSPGYVWGLYVYRTTDGGASWTSVAAPTLPLWSGTVVSDSLAYFSVRDTGIFTGVVVTRDGGATWAELAHWDFF
jgi:hypothetical protein